LDGFPSGLCLDWSQIFQRAALEISFDPPDNLVRGNQIHAMRKLAFDIQTELVRLILRTAVAERDCPRFPTAALGATGESADGMNELMARIGFPVDRLPSTCNHDAWPQPCCGSLHFHCGGQMHRAGYPAQNALSMIVQLQELPEHCLAAQINRSIQLRMMIAG